MPSSVQHCGIFGRLNHIFTRVSVRPVVAIKRPSGLHATDFMGRGRSHVKRMSGPVSSIVSIVGVVGVVLLFD